MLQRRLTRVAFASLMTLGAAYGSSACSGKKNTELVIAVQTDLRVPKDLNAVTIRVLSFGAVQHEDTYEVGPSGLKLPATIGVVPQDEESLKPIDIEIIGRYSSNPDPQARTERVIRKARLTFAKDRVGLVRLPLKFSCYDKTNCKAEETCVAGRCEKIPEIAGETLPEYSAEEVFGAGATDDDQTGDCWDGDRCLAQSGAIAKTADPCVFALAIGSTSDASSTDGSTSVDAGTPGSDGKRFEPGTPVTVVIAKTGGTLGFCSGGTCRIALDRDPVEGWDFVDDTLTSIRLSPGLCARMAEEGTWSIEATDGCPTKIASLPLCASTGAAPVTCSAANTPCSVAGTVTCVNTQTNLLHCGACGRACTGQMMCVAGQCADPVDSSVPDTAVVDTSLADTSVEDTAEPDTFTPMLDTGTVMMADTATAQDTSSGGPDTSVTDTSTGVDTAVADTSTGGSDTGGPDTRAAGADSSAGADTNTADTNTADTNTADTNTADTNTADTNTADTNTADTSPGADSAPGVDTAVPDTMPAGGG